MNSKVHVYCGDEAFRERFADWLEAENAYQGEFDLLIDRPSGWASLDHLHIDFRRCIVLSDNPCPTYRLDLLNKQPAVLAHLSDGDSLAVTLKAIREGKVADQKITSPLTPAERKTLRLIAFGYTNLEIADKRSVTERTVKNTIADIYEKLNLRSRVDASHYYLGHWHLIRNWEKPPFMT